jgi:hypothetical protein
LVTLEVGVEAVVEQVTHDVAELLDVLHALRPLPLGRSPVLRRRAGEPGHACPVGLDNLAPPVDVRLPDAGGVGRGDLGSRGFELGRHRVLRRHAMAGLDAPLWAPGL